MASSFTHAELQQQLREARELQASGVQRTRYKDQETWYVVNIQERIDSIQRQLDELDGRKRIRRVNIRTFGL